jgi:ABC-2 type transport system permease protein
MMFIHQLRFELWKLFGKKRTYIGFLMLLLAQNFVVVAFHYHGSKRLGELLEKNGFDPKPYISSLTLSVVMMLPISFLLLPLYTALIGGDLVAKEAEDGTLRMILSRPLSRFRLLFLKWTAGNIFSILLVMALGSFGFLFASMWFPWGHMFAGGPPLPFALFEPGPGFERYLLAQLCLIPEACTMMTLAFMFSCFNMKPAAATILALSMYFMFIIIQQIPFFADFREYLITYHMEIWREVLAAKIAWWKIGQSFSFLVGYNVTFLVVGFTAFQLRDIKS